MTQWPEPEARQLPPEGKYSFKINREPELKKCKDKNGKDYRRLIIFAVALGSDGDYRITDSFLPWEDRYTDLCQALGVEHGRDIQVSGKTFNAEIRHEADKKDPSKFYPRIDKIEVPGKSDEDDIPF